MLCVAEGYPEHQAVRVLVLRAATSAALPDDCELEPQLSLCMSDSQSTARPILQVHRASDYIWGIQNVGRACRESFVSPSNGEYSPCALPSNVNHAETLNRPIRARICAFDIRLQDLKFRSPSRIVPHRPRSDCPGRLRACFESHPHGQFQLFPKSAPSCAQLPWHTRQPSALRCAGGALSGWVGCGHGGNRPHASQRVVVFDAAAPVP